jgi:hypothetical protein
VAIGHIEHEPVAVGMFAFALLNRIEELGKLTLE